ncbi:MAG TPA: hypothetical protein VGL27_00480, partial [Negativicutes bacterium]
QTEQYTEFSYYSIILKDCYNKEALARRLEKVLLRSYRAVRMAVENVPGIAIYKGKVDDMIPILRVFQQEKAVISLIVGDVDAKFSYEDLFPEFHNLAEDLQKMLRGLPHYLWSGDSIQAVFTDVYQETTKGVLVVAKKAIYFLDKAPDDEAYHWRIFPYEWLGDAVKADDSLELMYRDTSKVDIFSFIEEQELTEAYEIVLQLMNNPNSEENLIIKTSCCQCNYTLQQNIGGTLLQGNCAKCGQKVKRILLKKR